MPFPNTPRVAATYVDGALKQSVFSTQPKILIVAPATSGLSDEIFNVSNTGAAEVEFGSATELARGMHEAVAQGADNIALMRTGGKLASFTFTDSAGGTLNIVPFDRDDEILTRYSLVIAQQAGANRILVYDLENHGWVYDSLEILVINEDAVDVNVSSLDLFTTGDLVNPELGITLTDLVTGDFTPVGVATATSVLQVAGADGVNVSLVEKYAALNRSYYNLDFKDADFIVPKGVYIDDQNVVDSHTCNFFKGVPAAESTNDTLGYVWQYEYQGNLYTYFVDSATYFTATNAAATVTVNTNLVLTAAKTGTGGNSISYVSNAAGTAGPTAVITEPTPTSLLISVEDDGSGFTLGLVTVINTALGLFTMANGKLASTIVTASVGGGATAIATVVSTPLASGTGGHVLSHLDLTGDAIPSAVSTAFTAADTTGNDSQLREVNFAHQLASFCYTASTTWKTMLGAISVKQPPGTSRSDIASWVGSPPHETQIGLIKAIDTPSDNGNGLLGMKLMVGKSITSNGYRAHLVEDGNSTDGYLYGGLIATSGLTLPNQNVDLAYGIASGDEILDENGFPVDIGKHIYVTVDWPIHRNAFNGSINYRGSIEAATVGLLATMPENLEPIGRDFPLRKITSIPRIHASQRDALSKFRFVNLRFEEGVGWVYNSIRTAAHKLDSDYTRTSTIRSVNKVISGIRNIAKNYIGKPFSSSRLASLQSDIDGYLVAEQVAGFHQGARAVLSYTRADRILGKLTIRVKMVPPFTIEEITEILSIAADETEL